MDSTASSASAAMDSTASLGLGGHGLDGLGRSGRLGCGVVVVVATDGDDAQAGDQRSSDQGLLHGQSSSRVLHGSRTLRIVSHIRLGRRVHTPRPSYHRRRWGRQSAAGAAMWRKESVGHAHRMAHRTERQLHLYNEQHQLRHARARVGYAGTPLLRTPAGDRARLLALRAQLVRRPLQPGAGPDPGRAAHRRQRRLPRARAHGPTCRWQHGARPGLPRARTSARASRRSMGCPAPTWTTTPKPRRSRSSWSTATPACRSVCSRPSTPSGRS